MVETLATAKGITHCGTMHADEVFASALLSFCWPDFPIIRLKEVDWKEVAPEQIVYDIGLRAFDHHQKDALVRPNGIKYCAFGLLFQEYGRRILQQLGYSSLEALFSYIDEDFVMAIDAIDNGVFPSIEASYKVKTVSDLIKLFNSYDMETESENQQFLKAVHLARMILEEEFRYAASKIEAHEKVLAVLEKTQGAILELEAYLPYEETILASSLGDKILFVIYPSNRGGYAVKTVPKSVSDRSARLLFPSSWAGLSKKELQQITGVNSASFCHLNLFIATAKTKEDAYLLAQKAIDATNK